MTNARASAAQRETAFKAAVILLFTAVLYLIWRDHQGAMTALAGRRTPDQIVAAFQPGGGVGKPAPPIFPRRPGWPYEKLITDNAFGLQGREAKTAPPTPTPTIPAPTTVSAERSGLFLTGTLVGSQEKYAFIYNDGVRKEDFYRVGDVLNGWRITDVRRNETDLVQGGLKTTLKVDFSKKRPTKGRYSAPPTPPRRSSIRRTAKPLARSGSTTTIQVTRSELTRNLRDFAKLRNQLRLQPYFERGKLAGFLLSNIRRGSFIQRMGARNGDVVKTVNGKAVDSVQKGLQLYNTFLTSNDVSVSVKRGGRLQTIRYKVR